MIIHVVGTAGTGKSYLTRNFENVANVIEVGSWDYEYSLTKGKKTHAGFKKFIDKKLKAAIKPKSTKSTILVGFLDTFVENKMFIYDLKADHKIFLLVDADTLFKQYNKRLINDVCNHNKMYMDEIENKLIPQFKSYAQVIRESEEDQSNYITKLKYKGLNQFEAFTALDKLVKKKVKDNT